MKPYLLLTACLLSFTSLAGQPTDYLSYVQQHCDNLIQYGQDQYGPRRTRMLASVIDTRDMSVPRADVPPTEGTRPHDRAVGGSNFYQDAETIRLLHALSALTGRVAYQEAARAYAQDFLALCQNPHTGLLAWGEHLYYNFYADSVMVGDLDNPRQDNYHEFLADTPPWEALWEVDTAATARAIAGIRYHFRSPTTQSFLFNRHAYWHEVDKKEYRGLGQYQDGGQPWIKHSGLQCYSFTFLYDKTLRPEWKRWAEGSGGLYWRYRHPETDLIPSCIDDPRPSAQHASPNAMALLSYYLLKSWQLHPELDHFRERAETLFKAVEAHAWNADAPGYYQHLLLEGSPAADEYVPLMHAGYGESGLLPFGRTAAYFYRATNDSTYRTVVQRVANELLRAPWPEDYVVNNLANAVHFSLDAYEVLQDDQLLELAQRYATLGIDQLWSGRLFVRQPGDPYYEAKVGTSALVTGLLRLHLLQNDQQAAAALHHWSP